MNWLIYIGGGGTVLIFWYVLLMFMFGNSFGQQKVTKITIPIINFIPLLMAWIWVCWRFIK